MLDPRRLQVLAAVAEHGSLSAAGAALGLTQPAVSHHVARLEEEAGVALVRRVHSGVTMTEAGVALARAGEAIRTRLAAAQDELDELRGAHAGRVALAGFPTALCDLLPRTAAVLLGNRPGLDCGLRELMRPAALAAVRDGAIDIAVVTEEGPVDDRSDLDAVLVMRDPLLVVLPREHPLAARSDVTLKQLAGESWVHGTHAPTHGERALAAAGVDPLPPVVLRTDDLLAVQGVVAARSAVALVPGLGLANTRRDVAVRAVQGADLHRDVFAICVREATPATRHAIEVLVAEGERLAA
jgi:DNA-binding transcriptional LysR family regulator